MDKHLFFYKDVRVIQVCLKIGRFSDKLSIKEESLLAMNAIMWMNHCQFA
jgi:hypothetical protein